MKKGKNKSRTWERPLAFDHFNILAGVYRLAVYDKKMAERNIDEGLGVTWKIKRTHNISFITMPDYLSACYFLRELPRKDICSKKDFYKWILKEIQKQSF